ncbi:MAG: response regulator transcription factor [Kiritimatiellae bacterium]|nr:response regulator transcription factor [Kiritimatiellia bacterium]MDW8458498.1 response regulator transcription factor [Verrucomicrobiota bacterium]
MAKKRILLIEDDEDIQELVSFHLGKEGYTVQVIASGEAALEAARKSTPDLILLDLMLPGIDGLQVCRNLRGEPKTRHIPIVMLTAKGEETDIVTGLEVGADDYITKPFSPRVLVARIRNVLRRKSRDVPDDQSPIHVHDLVIHPGRHEVLLKGKRIDLTFTEFRVLQFLARRPGWVYTRQQIVDAVRGEDYAVTDRSVDVQIVGLRRKLGPAGEYIETVRGVGYRFRE